MLLYQYLLHYGLLLRIIYINTYGYSLLFYKVYHEEGECRQLEFWLEKEQTLETYSAQLQKSWNSTKQLFGFNKNLWAKEIGQGAHTLSRRQGVRPRPPIERAPISWAPWWASGVHILLYHHFYPGKNRGQAYGTKLRCHEAEPWRNQSRALAELFCQGNFLPGGEIITIVITNAPLIGRGQSPSTSSSAPSHLKTLVHLLYPILVSKSGIGASRLLVVLITPCSWC